MLVRGSSLGSVLVYLAQWACFRCVELRAHGYWSHVALVVHVDGRIVEAGTGGVACRRLERYRDSEYHYIHLGTPLRARRDAVRFAVSSVGARYAYLRFFRRSVAAIVGDELVPSGSGHACASLVASALAHAGEAFGRSPADMLPADLARHYGLTPVR